MCKKCVTHGGKNIGNIFSQMEVKNFIEKKVISGKVF